MSHHLNKVVGVKNSASSPALSEMDRLSSSSPALLRPVHSMAAMALMSSNPSSAVTSPAFRGTVSSPAMPNRGIKSGQQQYQPSHISPSNSVASNASTSPGLSFCPSQTGLSNSSRPSTPSSAGMVIKSKAVSPGPGRPMSLFDSVAASVTNNNQLRGHKRPRDNDEDTMTGFEVGCFAFAMCSHAASIPCFVFLARTVCQQTDRERTERRSQRSQRVALGGRMQSRQQPKLVRGFFQDDEPLWGGLRRRAGRPFVLFQRLASPAEGWRQAGQRRAQREICLHCTRLQGTALLLACFPYQRQSRIGISFSHHHR